MALLRCLTALRVVVSKGFDFGSLLKGGDAVESKDEAEFEIEVAGEVHELDTVWKQIKGTEARVTKDFKNEEWANRAVNHPAGHIAEFWLKRCDLQRRESGGQIPVDRVV